MRKIVFFTIFLFFLLEYFFIFHIFAQTNELIY